MAKKPTSLRIDEELLDKVKENDLNLSKLVNDYLTTFFEYEGESIHRINREINEKNNEVMIKLMEIDELSKMRKQMIPVSEEQRKEKIWIEFRVEFYKKLSIGESQFDPLVKMDAEELLGYDFHTLCLMALFFRDRCGKFDCAIEVADQWKNVERNFLADDIYVEKNKEHFLQGFIYE